MKKKKWFLKISIHSRRMVQEQRAQKLNEEQKELTFKPYVSQKSKEMAKRNVDIANNLEKTEDFLIDIGKKTKEKLERKRQEKELEEMEKYSFHPQTNEM